ncbi:unnamed protein product [Lactuca saligna]|uniref:DUF4283 domain-containing protein n=1 Tax=Lactuca saligna TaxID=75948 RepID=A0AA35VA85_LACSI|nr:unnamed protein product [Lactuca saligna]
MTVVLNPCVVSPPHMVSQNINGENTEIVSTNLSFGAAIHLPSNHPQENALNAPSVNNFYLESQRQDNLKEGNVASLNNDYINFLSLSGTGGIASSPSKDPLPMHSIGCDKKGDTRINAPRNPHHFVPIPFPPSEANDSMDPHSPPTQSRGLDPILQQLSFGPNNPKFVQNECSFPDIVLGRVSVDAPPPLKPISTSPIPYSDADLVHGLNYNEGNLLKPLSLDFIDNIEIIEDDQILIPPSIMDKGSVPFERTLYGYFVGDRLAFPFVRDRVFELWKEHGLYDIFINSDDVFFFKFDNIVGMNFVLQKSIWRINGFPLFLRKWDPKVFIEKPTHDRVPVWVNIFGIPLQLFNKDGLSLIASKLGKPLEVDSYTTTMCERAMDRAVYARILIEMSAKDPWAKEIKIKAITATGSTSTTLKVEYSWIPKRCDHCKIFGHDHAMCPTHMISSPDPKSAMPTPKEVDNEGYQTVKRRSQSLPNPKKKIPINNRKGKGPAIKISQVYKPVTRVEPKKKVSTNMFDALSHQRVDDIDDASRVPPIISPSTTHPASDALPSSSHGGCISSPIDQG